MAPQLAPILQEGLVDCTDETYFGNDDVDHPEGNYVGRTDTGDVGPFEESVGENGTGDPGWSSNLSSRTPPSSSSRRTGSTGRSPGR